MLYGTETPNRSSLKVIIYLHFAHDFQSDNPFRCTACYRTVCLKLLQRDLDSSRHFLFEMKHSSDHVSSVTASRSLGVTAATSYGVANLFPINNSALRFQTKLSEQINNLSEVFNKHIPFPILNKWYYTPCSVGRFYIYIKALPTSGC